MTACRWVASDRPRVLSGHHEPDCPGDCKGCQECPERHCVVCGKEHAAVTCIGCVDSARDDLEAIARLCGDLPAEAAVKGVDSEAMMLQGPASDPEAWRNRAMSAAMGRLDSAYLDDCRDENHPLWILGTWEQIWRDHLDHATERPLTTASAAAYIGVQLAYMADQPEPAFEEFARELRACRGHLEDVLRDGMRDEHGAPCVQCERPMVRLVTDQGAQDVYRCHGCRREVSGDQYHYAVGVAYRAHATALTAVDLSERLGVKASVIRVWGARGKVAKRGRNSEGLILYDVTEAIAMRDRGAVDEGVACLLIDAV